MKIEDINLSFIEVELEILDRNVKDLFSLKNNKSLIETLNHIKYFNLKKYNFYKNDYSYPIGKYLFKLKNENNDKYLLFLNKYGDNNFCKFKIKDNSIKKIKGLYLFSIENEVKYIGRCLDSFDKRINNGYGRISPKNCYKDGQQTNCHINSLINIDLDKIVFKVYPMKNSDEIKYLEKKLIKKYKPDWNIALK